MTDIRTYCAHCASKCATVASVESGRLVSVRADAEHPNVGFCPKAWAAPEVVYSNKRLRTPLKRTRPKTDPDAGWVPISWDEALSTIAERLNAIKQESGAEAVAFSRPAPGGSPASDWTPYFGRLANSFGTPNTVATSHICQWGRDTGSVYTYGTGLPTPHFEAARTILIWGHNPESSHIQNWRRIRDAQQKGARLVVVDPRRTGTVEKADLWIQNKPGSDTALALGVVHVILRDRLYDRQFVTQWTNAPFLVSADTGRFLRGKDIGLGGEHDYVVWDTQAAAVSAVDVELHPDDWKITPGLEADIPVTLADGGVVRARSAFTLLRERVAELSPQQVSVRSGVPPEQIEIFARILATEGPLAYYSFNGIEQHVDTAQTTRALGILYALTGWLDAEGGNVNFSRPPAAGIDGTELLGKVQNGKRLGLKARPLSAARRAVQSYELYSSILGENEYRVRALVSFGGNLLIQNGDSAYGQRALRALEFQVHADAFLNPSAEMADILLPTTSPWEAAHLAIGLGGGPDTLGYVQYRPAVVAPQHESRSDVDVMFQLAVALGLGEQFWNGDVEASMHAQLAPLNLTLEQVKASPGGIKVELKHAFRKYALRDTNGHARNFPTPSRKVELYSQAYQQHGYDPLPNVLPLLEGGGEFPLQLTSYKLLEFCHSQGRGIPSLRRRVPLPYLDINPQTAQSLNVAAGEQVRLVTPHGAIELHTRLTDSVAPGVVATHTGWWESCEELGLPALDPFSSLGTNLNLIISNATRDPISGSVPHKSYPCAVEKITGSPKREATAPVAASAL